MFFLAYHYPYFYMALGEWSFLIKFVLLVSIGRIFHHCHYFGDTIVGALIGFLVAYMFSSLGLTVPVPSSWDAKLVSLVR